MKVPSPEELYLAGRFTEALAQASPALAARIHFHPDGASLNDPAASLRLRDLPDTRLALDPRRREPAASPLAQLEAQCKLAACDQAAIVAYRDQHKSELSALIRAGRLLLPLNPQAAGDSVAAALPLAQALHAKPALTIHDLHWTTATDELYADLLAHNRHLGHARGLYLKALAAYRYWPAPSAYTERRKKELAAKVEALDRALFAR